VDWKTKLFQCFEVEDIKIFETRTGQKKLCLINGECKRVVGLQEVSNCTSGLYTHTHTHTHVERDSGLSR